MKTITIAMGNPVTEAKNQNNLMFYKKSIFSNTSLKICLKFIQSDCHLRSMLMSKYKGNRIENKATRELP